MRARRSGALLLAAALTLLLAAVANACSVQELAARLPDASLFVELLSALGDEGARAGARSQLPPLPPSPACRASCRPPGGAAVASVPLPGQACIYPVTLQLTLAAS